ncbi:hypothetical protein [Desulfatibacillum alkenivorans]|jgi:hypothetical protein|uniref:hypothetical protein n=1 Tax=Desulfatibacillum alkenivorans TaxID=259354 RepID=UPI000935C5E8|nr:hypothetical protein [Desulfatibacillum alkenivorans]
MAFENYFRQPIQRLNVGFRVMLFCISTLFFGKNSLPANGKFSALSTQPTIFTGKDVGWVELAKPNKCNLQSPDKLTIAQTACRWAALAVSRLGAKRKRCDLLVERNHSIPAGECSIQNQKKGFN